MFLTEYVHNRVRYNRIRYKRVFYNRISLHKMKKVNELFVKNTFLILFAGKSFIVGERSFANCAMEHSWQLQVIPLLCQHGQRNANKWDHLLNWINYALGEWSVVQTWKGQKLWNVKVTKQGEKIASIITIETLSRIFQGCKVTWLRPHS